MLQHAARTKQKDKSMNTSTQQDQPQPGNVYSLATLAKTGKWSAAAIQHTGLPLGARVSYGDMANPRRVYVITETTGGMYGQKAIREDGQNASNVSQSHIDGPGGWQREPGEASPEQIEHLKQLHAAHLLNVKTEQDRQRIERDHRLALGKKLLAERMPAGTAAVIIAEYEIDDCDIMTDYFSTKTGRRVILAFSTHKRDLFSEMRKAAALLPETAHLATAGPEAEHREKYSMGSGYYLKAGGSYSTGWTVSKTYLSRAEEIAGQPDGWAPHFTAPKVAVSGVKESLTAAPAGGVRVRINEEKLGVEIHFTSKPSEQVRDRLKTASFRWSRFSGCWYSHATENRIDLACDIAGVDAETRAKLHQTANGAHHAAGARGMEEACGIA